MSCNEQNTIDKTLNSMHGRMFFDFYSIKNKTTIVSIDLSHNFLCMRVNTAITKFLVLDTCNTRCDAMTSFNAAVVFEKYV